MVIEFRVLAISKETQHYDTDMIRGVFSIEHPMLDAVDNLPPNAAITIITQCDWEPTTKEVIDIDAYILIPFVKE